MGLKSIENHLVFWTRNALKIISFAGLEIFWKSRLILGWITTENHLWFLAWHILKITSNSAEVNCVKGDLSLSRNWAKNKANLSHSTSGFSQKSLKWNFSNWFFLQIRYQEDTHTRLLSKIHFNSSNRAASRAVWKFQTRFSRVFLIKKIFGLGVNINPIGEPKVHTKDGDPGSNPLENWPK